MSVFTGLVDDAGLFPPESLPMALALARHRVDQAAAHPVHTGTFLCPLDRVAELDAGLEPGDRFRIGLIGLPDGDSGVLYALSDRTPQLSVVAVELRPTQGVKHALDVQLPTGVARFVELPVGAGLGPALELLGAVGVAAKVRCGGLRAELFPSPAELAGFVLGCVTRGVAFKATAGLHHAVRYRDRTSGFVHHGFLNLLLGTARALNGGAVADVTEVLESTDAAALAAEAHAVTDDQALVVRRAFLSYGSCSTDEPIADLAVLGLLDQREVGR